MVDGMGKKLNASFLMSIHASLKSQWAEISMRQENPEPRKSSSYVARMSTG